jgi:hypothetical protein
MSLTEFMEQDRKFVKLWIGIMIAEYVFAVVKDAILEYNIEIGLHSLFCSNPKLLNQKIQFDEELLDCLICDDCGQIIYSDPINTTEAG